MITENFGLFEVTGNFSAINNDDNLLQTSLNDTITIAINNQEILKIQGQVTLNLNTKTITVNGDVSTEISGDAIELFSGTASFSEGSQLQAIWNNITSKLNVSGFNVDLSSLILTSAGLQVQGSITLPDILGGESIAIEGNNFIVINSQGVSLNGGEIALSGQKQFSLGSLTLETDNLSLDISENPESFILQGDASLTGLIPDTNTGITADFAPPGFIAINPDANPVLSVNGDVSVSDVVIVEDVLEIKQFSVDIDTVDDTLSAKAILDIPDGIQLGGDISFVDGRLDAIAFQLDAENGIPLFEGVTLNGFGGDVENIIAQTNA